ncbi:hypothetical protein [Sphingomonas sanxanigenens]|uniref:Uncharacterized protein n=1 Tax=Sphingomonas sanxanigenens DSM 19645 = NX02 TaxID=1123269 RepID=W0AFX6_9SPHN|nr:hypothetical protein [Sphingomonas sanxanigenens]AHE55996.1 hypothetical protein NX02_21830 [Sphingomonas sanxanigenens DSM 19645 = NX02]
MKGARNPDGTYDGRKVLSELSGGRISPGEVQSIFDQVKANGEAWRNCPAPHHVVDRIEGKLPTKFRCRHCGATKGTEIIFYIEGFVAAGGDGKAVWPEWDR